MTIGERIRNERNNRKITLQEVADRLNISRQTAQRYETGEIKNIPSDKIELIAEMFGVSSPYLMGWEEEKEDGKIFYRKEHQELIEATEELSLEDLEYLLSLAKRMKK